ncbi:MAG: hypothetical protein H8E66_21240 [Planctomycetes bacterium]|nr:hypothetical protein [Planctomycetota bacterium]
MVKLTDMLRTPISRRRLFQAVSAGVMGHSLPQLLALESTAGTAQAQAKQVLVVYEEGGIS